MISRRRYGGMTRALAAALAILTVAMLSSGCSCALKQVIDQATVTVRGLAAANEVSAKANEGYDVREARARWLEALDAYNQGDFTRANQLVDEVYAALSDLEKVAERVFYQSSGGLTVSGLLFRPTEGEPPWPTIIVNHAGFGTAGDFSDVALIMRDWGYMVFNPDFRGSGESQGVHEGAKGEVDDVIYAIDYLESQGLVEGGRIGLYGQSHGAAVSMGVAGRSPEVKAVVAEAGFYDAADLYYSASESTDPGVKPVFEEFASMVGGSPEELPQEYEARSAINHAQDVRAAVLLIHGEQDPLIPVDQAYMMYEALRAAGVTVELKIYPDEAHCVNDPAGRAEVWEMTRAWFDEHV